MSIIAVISADFLDATGPFTDSYFMDAVWILMLAGIYLIYVKEDVWKQVTLLTVQLKDAKAEANTIQLMHTVDGLRDMVLKLIQPKPATPGG